MSRLSEKSAADESARPRRDPVTRARVIEAALRVMDQEGLEAVTMRRVGRELGVEAMSLYNHVRDKEDILDGVTELAMNDFQMLPPTGDWAEDARRAAREWRRILRTHPSVMSLLAERHKPLEGLAAYLPMEYALEIFHTAGLEAREAVQAFNAFGSYIMGFVIMEQGLMPGHSHEDHEHLHDEMARVLDDAGSPRLREAFVHFAECSDDEQFEFGLDLLIQGLRSGLSTGTDR